MFKIAQLEKHDARLKGATSPFRYPENFSPYFSINISSFVILYCLFMIFLVLFYRTLKLSFSDFIQVYGNFAVA